VVDHVTGGNYILRHEDGRRAAIPMHNPVKTGLLQDQLKNGIDWEDMQRAVSTHSYIVIVHRDLEDGGFWTEVPALPGCGSQGETVDEAVATTRDAIDGFLASLAKHGESAPDETNLAVTVTVGASGQ
jgi:predicted RNase H-like HicB family nuclease